VPIAINPVAQWETKLWLPERFAELADRLIDHASAPVFFSPEAGPIDLNDQPDHPTACTMMPRILQVRPPWLNLAALYRRMAHGDHHRYRPHAHIAAAVDTPVVALFGPTAEWRTGPYGDLNQIVAPLVDCRPCFKRTCSHCTCMRRISVEDVMNKVQALM
jgi:heptosyltransferase-1